MVVLYSNHCPKCNIIMDKLNAKKIKYTLVDDEKTLIDKGFDFMPVLEVDGTLMTSMMEINDYINKH